MTDLHTKAVVDFIVSASPTSIPEQVLHTAQRAFIDTIGVILFGAGEELSKILLAFAIDEGARPRSLLLGSRQRSSPHMAALANGATAHAVEYDDAGAEGHLSAVIVPAVLALAEDLGASGAEAMTAYCVGFEVAAKVGMNLMGDDYRHHQQGWHSTVAIGVMGAAGAAAYLLKLSPAQTACALGMAATYAAGLRKNFGTMTKPFHCGHAAHGGIVSATLAKAGFTANPAIMDAPQGYFEVLVGEPQAVASLQTLGRSWSLLKPGLNVKRFPCCYLATRAADAVLSEGEALQMEAQNIVAVEVHMPSFAANTLVYDLPQSGLEGKFSVQYVVAASLLDGALEPTAFTNAMVQRTAAQALMKKICKVPFDGDGAVKIVIRLADGQDIVRVCESAQGSFTRPLSDAQIDSKFLACAASSLGEGGAQESLSLLHSIRELPDIRVLMQRLEVARA